MNKILVVDDQRTARKGITLLLKSLNFESDEAASLQEAESRLQQTEYDLVITDLRLPDEAQGLEVIRRVRTRHPLTPILVVTAYGSVDSAVKAMQNGADDYVTKDFSREELLLKIKRLMEIRKTQLANLRLHEQVNTFREKYRDFIEPDTIVGESPQMKQVMDLVARAAEDNDATVLITGESGTGKELIARAIHWNSPIRHKNQFVIVDVANLPANLLESELFGHEKGAFTSAHQMKKGKFEVADGGSVFLDEIGDFSPELQTKLLRFLQERTFSRVGGIKQLYSNVRIIAATNKNLEEMVEKGSFRQDLFFRLNVVRIHLPPLRERKSDIPALLRYFSARLEEQKGRHLEFPEEIIHKITEYSWPGNVRQLKNFLERLYITCNSGVVREEHLMFQPITTERSEVNPFQHLLDLPLKEARQRLVEEFEKFYLSHHLNLQNGNISKLASEVGESREGLSKKIKRYGLKGEENNQKKS
ncbi:MAG: sigma-54 dependent transcriptional regulator [Calditrichia bacterium]